MLSHKSNNSDLSYKINYGDALSKAAQAAVCDVLGVKRNEHVLIITNPHQEVFQISYALYTAVKDTGGAPTLVVQEPKTQFDFAERSVIHAIRSEPEVVISISEHKLGKDHYALKHPYTYRGKKYDHIFRYLLRAKRIRSFWSPGITTDMFIRTVPIDYKLLQKRAQKLKSMLDSATELKISSPIGTDIIIGIRKRKAMVDDGNFKVPGSGGNLPAGEVYISPALEQSEGIIKFDGSISLYDQDIVIPEGEPITVKVKSGFATVIEGDGNTAKLLKKTLTKAERLTREWRDIGKIPKAEFDTYLRNIRNLGEVGIGLNPNAKIIGNVLEDEKVYGTCHIALGSNYDDDAKAVVHLDGLICNPTIVAYYPGGKSQVIIANGKLTIQV